MKVALAQLNYHIGNIKTNKKKIKEAIDQSKKQDAHLIVFAELAICGYPPLDLLESDAFIDQCQQAIAEIASACDTIACIIGLPVKNKKSHGRKLSNVAYFIENQQVKAIVHKTLLPNYDVFDECRYFEPATACTCIGFMGNKIALTICEDLWNDPTNSLYLQSPMDLLIKEKPDLMINIAASPFAYDHHERRIAVLSKNCLQYGLPLFYVNQIGAQTELIFDGRSLIFDAQGALIDEMPAFTEATKFYEFQDHAIQRFPSSIQGNSKNPIQLIHDALILGIRDYFSKSGFSKVILGLSGGIDSALVCTLASRALGPKNVLAVIMPSEFSSEHALKDALALVKNLPCEHQIIPINDLVAAFDSLLNPYFHDFPLDSTEENIQSRCRAITMMALSNKWGHILLNTSNKSELAVGYSTLYGDMAGAIGVIGDLYKTQVYQLAEYINQDQEIIPSNIFIKAPSAELRPNQRDSDSLPEYDLLDAILFEYIELKKSAEGIIAMGFDAELVHHVLNLVKKTEFKRYQTPPILRVSSKAFGFGRRMPVVSDYLS